MRFIASFELPPEVWVGKGKRKKKKRLVFPPTQNVWQRLHWAVRSQIQEWVDLLILTHRKGPKATKPRHVEITLWRKQLADPDSLGAYCKTINDGLVHAGLLVDDSAKWLNLTVRQFKSVKPSTHVSVLECESDAEHSYKKEMEAQHV